MILITLIVNVIWIHIDICVKAIALSLRFFKRLFRRYADMMFEEYEVSYTGGVKLAPASLNSQCIQAKNTLPR